MNSKGIAVEESVHEKGLAMETEFGFGPSFRSRDGKRLHFLGVTESDVSVRSHWQV